MDVIDVTYDPCSPLTIVPEGADTAEVESVEMAIRAWKEVIPIRAEVGDGSLKNPSLPIRFASGDTFFRAIYWDNTGEIEISRERLAAEDYPIAIAHELGHAFGLFHVPRDERPSVMNLGNLEVAPNEDDGLAVRDLWDACR